jgi:hypothetical protein
MKKIRGDKPIGDTWKYNKETSYVATLSKAKMLCFSFSLFSFFLLQNCRTGRQNKSCQGGEGWHKWDGRGVGKGGRRVNTVQ